MTELVTRDGRVTGIRGHWPGGPEITEHARVVVGADGHHSLVARSVGAEAYNTRPPLQVSYYTYVSGLPMDGRLQVYLRPGRGFAAWPTNDGQTVVIGGWPLMHVCAGVDPLTMRPRVAKGIIAIGNIAVGGIAIGGLAAGVLTLGGLSLGGLVALGGAALGFGLSIGGFAVGSVAIGGAAAGFVHAIGGAAFGPSIVDGRQCDPEAAAFVRDWLGAAILPPSCR